MYFRILALEPQVVFYMLYQPRSINGVNTAMKVNTHRIGVGLGLGLMRYQGNLTLDGPAGQETITLSDDSTQSKIASSFMLESRWNHWGIIISAAGPTLEKDTYQIQVEDVAINLGYSFVF